MEIYPTGSAPIIKSWLIQFCTKNSSWGAEPKVVFSESVLSFKGINNSIAIGKEGTGSHEHEMAKDLLKF